MDDTHKIFRFNHELVDEDLLKYKDSIREAIEKFASELSMKKEKILKEKLKEIVGIDINIEQEYKRRFPRLVKESGYSEESFFFNDGSIKGIRIVTFVRNETYTETENHVYKINAEYSYY